MLRNCSTKHFLLSRLLSLAEPQAAVRVGTAVYAQYNSVTPALQAARSLTTSQEAFQDHGVYKWIFSGAAIGAAAASLVHSQAESQLSTEEAEEVPSVNTSGWHLLSVETKQRLFYNYEKRIRELSSLEKIFEYFASEEKDGIKYMLPSDVLRSIIATFPPYGSSSVRGGSLEGEWVPKQDRQHATDPLFDWIDVDGDHLVSFPEYLLLLALLSIPLRDIATVFRVVDVDSNGKLDAAELGAILHMLQAKAGLLGTSPRVGRATAHKALNMDRPVGLFTHFFGADLKGEAKVEQLLDFLNNLHDELTVLEFSHYDVGNTGGITCRDMAASLLASSRGQQSDRLLSKMSTMPEKLSSQRITLAEFKEVSKLYKHPYEEHLVTALEFYAMLGRPMHKEDVHKLVCGTLGIKLPDSVLDTLFHLFGEEDSLDWKLLVDVLRRRNHLPGHRGKVVQRKMQSPAASAQLYWRCVRSCVDGGGPDEEDVL